MAQLAGSARIQAQQWKNEHAAGNRHQILYGASVFARDPEMDQPQQEGGVEQVSHSADSSYETNSDA